MTENNDNNPTSTPAPDPTPEPITTPEPPVIDNDMQERAKKNAHYYARNPQEADLFVAEYEKALGINAGTQPDQLGARIDRLERDKVTDKVIQATGIQKEDFERYIHGKTEAELMENAVSFLERDAAKMKQISVDHPTVPGTDKPYATSKPAPALPQYGSRELEPASETAKETVAALQEADWFKELPG